MSNAQGQVTCAKIYLDEVKPDKGPVFLNQKYSGLSTSKPVIHRTEQIRHQTGQALKKPADKISAWLKFMEQSSEKRAGQPAVLARIKESYHEKYVTKAENVPEGFFDLQVRIAREQGRGKLELTPEMRKTRVDRAIQDQKKSLDDWIEYFFSSDSKHYPMWAKYWSLQSLVKLTNYDVETGKFGNRKDSMLPFPELNRAAFATVVDAIIKKVNGKELSNIKDPEMLKLLEKTSFADLYGRALFLESQKKMDLTSTEGRWVTYPQGSDPKALVESLREMSTGWCTAGEATAKSQLADGDFHVFYTKDEDGKIRVPRLAIRMDGSSIAEVRGVGKDQNLDAKIAETSILQDKLNAFGPEGQAYQTKTAHMKRLTEIEKHHLRGEKLSKEDLRFLYEIDTSIMGFGYDKDPRILEIIGGRNIKSDLATALGIKESEISFTKEEALRGGMKYHYGDLDLSDLQSAVGLNLPEMIRGDLKLTRVESARGLKLPKKIGGDVNLTRLKSADGLKLPDAIGGSLLLHCLQSAHGLKLPEKIGGSLVFSDLKSADGLKLPDAIGGNLVLSSLQSADGLKFPDTIGGDLQLNSLQSADGLKLPKKVEGNLCFNSLQAAVDLRLPEKIGGSLFLYSLELADGLKFPDSIGGDLLLNGLKSAMGLILPRKIGGNLYLFSLASSNGLVLSNSTIRTLTIRRSLVTANLLLQFQGELKVLD